MTISKSIRYTYKYTTIWIVQVDLKQSPPQLPAQLHFTLPQ